MNMVTVNHNRRIPLSVSKFEVNITQFQRSMYICTYILNVLLLFMCQWHIKNTNQIWLSEK